MRKLKIQFLLFFVLLASIFAGLFFDSYRQRQREERALWVGLSQKTYNQMQLAISEWLNREDSRSFAEYRYYHALLNADLKSSVLNVSPLGSTLSDSDPRGLLGYFQIDPDGSFSTPYLPKGDPQSFSKADQPLDFSKRLERQATLEQLTRSLRSDPRFRLPYHAEDHQEEAVNERAFIDLDRADFAKRSASAASTQNRPEADSASQVNFYPNPVKSKQGLTEGVLPLRPFKAQQDKPAQVVIKEEDSFAQLSRRSMTANALEWETFSNVAPQKKMPGPEPARDDESQAVRKNLEQPSLWIDPFQARWLASNHLIFYRKVWNRSEVYVQGLVLDLPRFYAWLMEQSFENSDLVHFASARLQLRDRALAVYGAPQGEAQDSFLLFEHALQYPLNLFGWSVHARFLPQIGTQFYFNFLGALVFVLTTVGLYFIYRSAASQVLLSQKRQDFVSAVTHELKTPLTSIRLYSEMLEDGWILEEPKRQEYYRYLNKESARLTLLIDQVLQLASLEKKTYAPKLKRASPETDFDEIATELARLAAPKGYAWVARREPELGCVAYDAEGLKQVFIALLDNSLKFSAGAAYEKKIEMHLSRQGNELVWELIDGGPGIPERELKQVFEKFYRVENELTRNTRGTGIGLAIAKMLVEAMGGHIEAVNRPTCGLSMRLRFRLLEADTAP